MSGVSGVKEEEEPFIDISAGGQELPGVRAGELQVQYFGNKCYVCKRTGDQFQLQ